jgi:hypothetical protein
MDSTMFCNRTLNYNLFLILQIDSSAPKRATVILHSTAYYLSSYIFALLVYQFLTALTARFFNIVPIIHFNKVEFIVNARLWTYDSVKMIFISGCVSALIFGLCCLVIYIKAISMEGLLKLFFLWGFIHGLNIFVGSFVIGAFIYEGMGYVYAWMYLQETEKMFLLFAGLILLLGSGTIMIKSMLLAANSYYNSSRPEDRLQFKLDQYLFPYLIGTAILLALRFPVSIYEALLLVTPIFMILPLFIGFYRFTIFFFDENERSNRLRISILIFAIVLMAAYRVVFGFGIRLN